jgi:hypothetical protein
MSDPSPAAVLANSSTQSPPSATIAKGTAPATKRPAWVSVVIVFVAFLLLVWLVQQHAGAPTAAFGAFPDEPAHFVGGLLFHDYLNSPSRNHPINFVSDYHLHLPYFALGVWPPFFYLIEGVWMEAFGDRRGAILWLIALIAAGLAVMLYRILQKQCGTPTAVAGGAMLLLVPIVQWSECIVMADLICSLFAMAAIIYFARFMDSRRWADSVLFGVFAGLALLTKNSTYFLAFIPVIVILAARRWDLLRVPALYIGPVVVAAFYLPWLLISRPFLLLGIHGLDLPGFWGIQRDYLVTLWREMSFLLLLAAGGASFLIASKRPVRPIAMCMLAVIPAISIGILVGRVPVQDRLLIVSYAAVIYLACEFVVRLAGSWKRPAVMLACLAVFAVLNWGQFSKPPVNHIHGTVAFLQARDGDVPGAILAPSNGEGPWIAEFAQTELKRPLRVILRPTKLFGEEDWNGSNWHPYFNSAAEIDAFFQRTPVKYCILAPSGAGRRYPHDSLLESEVAGNPAAWHLIFNGEEGYQVYENAHWTPGSEPIVLKELRRLSPSYLR